MNLELSGQISIVEIENEFLWDFKLSGNSDKACLNEVGPTCTRNSPTTPTTELKFAILPNEIVFDFDSLPGLSLAFPLSFTRLGDFCAQVGKCFVLSSF